MKISNIRAQYVAFTDKSDELFKTASIETSSSEIEVPNPINTSPIKNSQTLNFLPRLTALIFEYVSTFNGKV